MTALAVSRPALPAATWNLAAFRRRLDPNLDAPLAVAFSGGGDSLALLLAAMTWADGCGRRLLALHVDHGLQAHSASWAAFAVEICAGLDIPIAVSRWRGPKPDTGLPAAARSARLRLLARAARDAGAVAIALGHTADDIAEGELMRAEGSSLGRLGEWTPSPVWPEGRGLFHFRPLLAERRADLRQRLQAAGRVWIDDPVNQEPAYARARARLRLAGGSDGAVETSIGGVTGRAPRFLAPPDGALRLRRSGLQGRVLSAACLCASGGERPPRGARLAALAARLAGGAPVTATLGGARIETVGDDVLLCRDAGEFSRSGAPVACVAPGQVAIWDGRFEIGTSEPGWRVRPLGGMAASLPPAERRELRAFPAAVRPGLPVLIRGSGAPTCPILADWTAGGVRALAGERLLAAVGGVADESAAWRNQRRHPILGVET